MRTRTALFLILVPTSTTAIGPAALAQGCALELTSVGAGGAQANGSSAALDLTPDGRFVAFASAASNLVPGDLNGSTDIFVRDRAAASTARASVASDGSEADALSDSPSLSDDGRYVAFASVATNLAGVADPARTWDVFLHDRLTGTTRCLSLGLGGTTGNGPSIGPEISGDGRFVVFTSAASDLVRGDTNTLQELFVYEVARGSLQRLLPGQGRTAVEARRARISADGRWVAFDSPQADVVPGDGNGASDVFVHDRWSSTTQRASVTSQGGETHGDSLAPSLSADGTRVSFLSDAADLVPWDRNGTRDVFVHDLRDGKTRRASLGSSGGELYDGDDTISASLSPDGQHVGIATRGRGLDPRGSILHQDAYVHELATGITRLVSLSSTGHGADAATDAPALGQDAGVLAFRSWAENLVPGDLNQRADVFVRSCPFPEFFPYTIFCIGIGGQCPCNNNAGPDGGCANNWPTIPFGTPSHGATLAALGTARVSADTLQFLVYGIPDGTLMVFVQSNWLPLAPILRGDGLACIGGPLLRLAVRSSQGNVAALGYGVQGDAPISILGALPILGGPRSYQTWYRSVLGPCGTRMNTTNAMLWNWLP